MTAPVFDIKDAISEAVASAIPAPVADTPVAPQTDDAEADEAPEADAPEAADAEADAEAEQPAVELPEGYVAVPSVTEGLATEFALFDDDGEVEVPALMVEYKANGKIRKDRLDQVVKLAQWGVYNEERDRKATAIEQEYQNTLAAVQEMEQTVAEREAQMERLLNDEEFLEAVREAYYAENSPEKRAERAERETNNLRVSYQMQQIQSAGEQFYSGEVLPAVQMITDALPNVTPQELESRLHMVMQAHAETAPNGQPYVPPSRYDAIRQYIVDDLALWAQMVNAKRSQPVDAEKASVKAELDRARVEAQKAKNLVGKAMKPAGQAGKATDAPKRSAKPATVDDAISSALSSVLSSISS
jgi:hypothetical protein